MPRLLPWPPPIEASGNAYAYAADGTVIHPIHGRYRGDGWTWNGDGPLWAWSGPDIPDVDHIAVWPFYEAPGALRALSPHGGDEDWLALVPAAQAGEYIGWLNHGPFGVCDISRHELADGRVVCIGAHS